VLLRSINRSFWEQIYSVDDIHIKALYVQKNTLFIGTAPKGQIYLMNLITNNVSLSQEIGNEASNFIYYKNTMYASGGIPNQIWSYNLVTNKWDVVYSPHATIITKMLVFQDKLYVFSNSENIISFDGEFWKVETTGVDNISSIRATSTEPFSVFSGEQIDRKLAQKSSINEVFEPEDVYDIYPMHYSRGVGSADIDGNSLVIGSSNYSKIYNLIGGTLYPIFQTEELNTIHSLLNLDVGVNLASVDNKLYLIYCGEISDATTTSTTTTEIPRVTTTTTTSKVAIFYPVAGDNLVVGTTITIQWLSTSSINDSVKIDLYKDNESVLVINPSTSNDGTYDWDIPSSLIPGADYKIVLTWLSALPAVPGSNVSESGRFGIWYAPFPTTTTTTTTLAAVATPVTANCRGIPLLDLANNEYITFMMKDVSKGGILIATSNGRIIGCEQAFINAYLTGDRDIYAEVKDGFGNVSDTTWASVFYELYNKIAEVNEQKEIVKWKYVVQPSAILTDRITGVFLSPILSVKQDLNFWKQLIWQETKPDSTEIIICVRAADSEDLLRATPWDYCFVSDDSDGGYGSAGFITRELSDYQIKGKYLQFKVTMTTDAKNITPSVLNLAITYSTKFATYFFTTKFVLENESNVKSGMFVANMTEPINTEIKFGIAGTNSADWNDYEVVPLDKLFSLNNIERLKVGIKMIAYDDNTPEVAEFSLLTGSEKQNGINEL
jgi:hypothetical protein